jgi:hypothetical protein
MKFEESLVIKYTGQTNEQAEELKEQLLERLRMDNRHLNINIALENLGPSASPQVEFTYFNSISWYNGGQVSGEWRHVEVPGPAATDLDGIVNTRGRAVAAAMLVALKRVLDHDNLIDLLDSLPEQI